MLLPFLAAMSIFFASQMLQNYGWVELAGHSIRAQKFWTRQVVEFSVDDVEEIVPLAAIVKSLETQVVDALMGENRGFEIRFKQKGSKIALIRYVMTNVDELAGAILARLRR